MNKEKKIALIELTTYHEECLYSQLQFLKDTDYDVTLVINPKNAKNISYYGISNDRVILMDPRSSSFFLKRIFNWMRLYKFLTKNGFEKIIFNTASSNKEIIALTVFLPKSVKCYGIIHNLKKLNSSTSQKLISKRIKDYFVLNDFLKDSIEIENKDINLHSFYPVFFPRYEAIKIMDKNSDFWICIPGELNYNRRDYTLILKALANLDQLHNLKIIILGKMNEESEMTKTFMQQINTLKIKSHIVTFDQFIENEVFHTYLKKSDFIMAPVSLKEKKYLTYKITGAYNLAFAYKKPLICPKELSIVPDLKYNSLFYSDEKSLTNLFFDISNGLPQNKYGYEAEKWSFDHQQKKYLKLLGI